MASLGEMLREIEALQEKVEFQTKLTEYWEGRWKQEFVKKLELEKKHVDIQKKYYEALELIYDKSEEVCPPIPIASQGVVNNQGNGGEGSSNGSKRKRKGSDGDLVPISLLIIVRNQTTLPTTVGKRTISALVVEVLSIWCLAAHTK